MRTEEATRPPTHALLRRWMQFMRLCCTIRSVCLLVSLFVYVCLTLQSFTRTMASAASPAEVHTTCESTRLVFTRWSTTCSRLL